MTGTWPFSDSPKMVRETLCVAQAQVSIWHGTEHAKRLQRLIDFCDVHRPLGPDGKHGDRHTATCGCEVGPAVCSGYSRVKCDRPPKPNGPRCQSCEDEYNRCSCGCYCRTHRSENCPC